MNPSEVLEYQKRIEAVEGAVADITVKSLAQVDPRRRARLAARASRLAKEVSELRGLLVDAEVGIERLPDEAQMSPMVDISGDAVEPRASDVQKQIGNALPLSKVKARRRKARRGKKR
jgi:hypothetical protein